jgi:hypothetical protein
MQKVRDGCHRTAAGWLNFFNSSTTGLQGELSRWNDDQTTSTAAADDRKFCVDSGTTQHHTMRVSFDHRLAP